MSKDDTRAERVKQIENFLANSALDGHTVESRVAKKQIDAIKNHTGDDDTLLKKLKSVYTGDK